MQCDHTVHFSADLNLWLDSRMYWALSYESMSAPTPGYLFSSSTWKRGRVRMYRAESRSGHSIVVSIRVPETVLRVKVTGQWAWLG